MKKLIYTILSILSIVYIAFMITHVLIQNGVINPDMGGFTQWFNFIVNFGGVAIIFCFALVNFAGNPLKIVFFILLIIAIIIYIVVLVCPDFIYNIFNPAKP